MPIERELMRSCLLEAMRRQPRTQFENLKSEVARVAIQRGLANPDPAGGQPYLRLEDHRGLREAVWELIVEGVMTVGMDASNENWPFLSLTEYGEEHVKNPAANPHEIGEYMKLLREVAPLGEIEERYVTQALQAFRRNLPDATAVMIGAASEHLLILLLQEIGSKDTSRKAAAEKALDGPALGMLRFARDYFVPLQSKLPRELRENFETTFLGVAALIRVGRNDAGHPALPSVDREQAFVNLRLYPGYRAWLQRAKTLLPL